MKRLAILGSTGSIGTSTLDIVASFPDAFEVVALSAGRNVELLQQQIDQFHPRIVSVKSAVEADQLKQMMGTKAPEILIGEGGAKICAAESDADMVVSAMVGFAGLGPTLAAINAGIDIALANKEVLVTAGELVMAAVERAGISLYPVDSEHSAIFQSLQGHQSQDVERLVLTASGGPFRKRDVSTFPEITREEALAHPNWDMGAKISIDSATMMNKGLEVIEACWLFNLPADRVKVLVHPESIVHSMVEYIDGSVIAQLGIPDMRVPISYALSCPDRLPLKLPSLDLGKMGSLTFSEPDLDRFPCLRLAWQAFDASPGATAVLNAANEIAVEAFLQRQIGFTRIPEVIERVLAGQYQNNPSTIEDIYRLDADARDAATRLIKESPAC